MPQQPNRPSSRRHYHGDEDRRVFETAWDEHDPTREPYASMSRDEILAVMADAKEPSRWAMLEQFLLDKMTTKELDTHNRAQELTVFLIRQWEANGNAQCCFLAQLAGEVAARIADEMPPIGPAHECN